MDDEINIIDDETPKNPKKLIKVVYTPRAQVGVSKLATSVKYNCQAYEDQAKRRKEELDKLVAEIERRNTENYNL